MGFAQEVIKARQEKSAPQPAPEAPAAEAAPETKAEDIFNNVVEAPKEETPKAAAQEVPPMPNLDPPKETVKTKIKIGAQEFDDVEKAIAYAQELELAVLQQDAFNAGKEAAKKPVEAAKPERTIEDELADQLFEDPKKVLQEYKKHIAEEIKTQIKQEETQAQQIKQTWDSFYETNADLSKHSEVVKYIMEKNWNEIGYLPLDKGLSKLAEKTRAFLGSYREQALPNKELPSKAAVTPMGGNPATTTPEEAPKTALDFITQLNKLRKKA